MNIFDEIAFKPCDILIPKDSEIYDKWAVIACDQFTSQPEYWEKVKEITTGFPSAFNIIFPEVYLENGNPDETICFINSKMEEYLKEGIFQTLKNSLVLLRRSFPGNNSSRKGLIAAFDLEAYDYSSDASSLIRATEGTVLDRIPPRVKIRQNASLETPHIMILIDDPNRTVIEPLFDKSLNKLYDFDLMCSSGHIEGYQICAEEDIMQIASALKLLRERSPLLYAVGDGNHSLASAKAHWENVKKTLSPNECQSHPARFALAELVNVHDDSLLFESINRICFNVSPQEFLEEFKMYYSDKPATASIQTFKYSYADIKGEIEIPNCSHSLEIGTLQEFLDYKMANTPGMKIDYIHGEDVVYELSRTPNSIGFILPAMSKDLLFPSVEASGALPRKTFSIGEASEKRFYFECRRISEGC